MGRITTRRAVTKIVVGSGADRRVDTLAVEEPLEIRVAGSPLAVSMRTPGHDVELAAGFLVSESVISRGEQFASAIHCGGPGTGGELNQYNVLDVALAPGVAAPSIGVTRNFYTTSSCGMCGKASIDAVETVSSYDVAGDQVVIDATDLADFPARLRARQAVFDKTGGLHAAALFDAATGELLVLREDVGRHNAVDKVVGWAVLNDRLPLRGTVLQVSGRASFELVQKAVMAGIPVLAAVSAPSSLAVELADRAGLTVVGFLRGETMNVYTRPERIAVHAPAAAR
ncbi:formate dehydrogenase accessory sulfurtransferase FdhD [Tsukamurella paurometabola]|uniref:Sulfur carrier protein FdhD n=1 Tax=Tsukamurella paurometabola (strain ATCC 8368 / DSM 20162 / CCUG 35730 / CIP 100753 / JCM 10117 / KCTC 9821 / NBRC 16120 / NCIMB 702349 / NCTC 13040) TaxID=521096 RepID=D5UQI2_TSUPD|nr:formate dehydrogenase accessory sulfurtransferase FdhD [Tsukamurella paurometabola]ADG78952.1 formate dehydrogenase family accessory protein FdhD [Tsukamurella paurometabola DSM 20162]SUP33602.1 formate dehydrogenase accessory protein [Tsukamurella paurometabola]